MYKNRTKSYNVYIIGLYKSATLEKHVEEYNLLKLT